MSETGSESLPAMVLTPPEPVGPVDVKQLAAGGPVPIAAEERAQLDERVKGFVTDLTLLPVDGEEFNARVEAIARMGDREVEASAGISNRLLARPLKAAASGGGDAGATIARGLIELRNVCEDLDPKRQNLFAPAKLLGFIPFGNRLRSYFQRYQSAQSHLESIMTSLMAGKDGLLRDNASIDQERSEMWSLMGKLEQCIYVCKAIDAELSARVAEIATSDPERAKRIEANVLFYARQKSGDLLTQMAVNAQGYMALDVIKRNNVELIKGVDRARTRTLSALRTAVIVSSALSNQKLVLDRINALRDTTGTMIESTGAMLQSQSAQIFKAASDPAVDVAKLQSAFDSVYATIDTIDAYKSRSLGAMQQTVDALSGQVERAKIALAKAKTSDG